MSCVALVKNLTQSLQLLDAFGFSVECIAQHRPCSRLNLGLKYSLLGEMCESASSLSRGKSSLFPDLRAMLYALGRELECFADSAGKSQHKPTCA